MEKHISCAVLIAASFNPYLLLGSQGTRFQGLVELEGLQTPIPFRHIASATKANYAAAVNGVTSIPIADGVYTDKRLVITVLTTLPSEPKLKKKIFANCSIGPEESLTDEQWLARCVSAINNNESLKQVIVASISGQNLLITEVIPQNTEVFVDSNVSSIIPTVTTQGRKVRGYSGAMAQALVNSVTKNFNIAVLGTPNYATENFDVYEITYHQKNLFKPFNFSENQPFTVLILVETNRTTFETALENLLALNSSFSPLYGTADFTDATATASTNRITKSGHGYVVGDKLLVTQVTNGAPLVAGSVVTVLSVVDSSNFTVAQNGTLVDITSDGTGIGLRKINSYPIPDGTFAADATANELLAPGCLTA